MSHFAILAIEGSEQSSSCRATAIKTGLVVAAFAGRIAFIKPIAALTSNEVGSTLLVTANVISFGSLFSYASLEWLKDINSILSSRSSGPSLRDVALLGVSVVGGILAQGPIFAQAYLFNDRKWLYVGLTALDSILSIYSLQMSLGYLVNQCRGGEIEKKTEGLKKEILQKLEVYQANFNSFSRDDVGALERRVEQVTELEILTRDLNPEERGAELLDTILTQGVETRESSTTCTKISNCALSCFGHLLTLILLSGGGYFTYGAVKSMSSNDYLATASALGVSLINLYLSGQILSRSTKQIGHAIKDLVLCQSRGSLEEHLMYKTTLVLKGSAIGLGFTASAGAGMIWGHQFPNPESDVITALAALTIAVYILLPMQTLAKELTQQIIFRFGNEEGKKLIRYSRVLISLQRSITHSREGDLVMFLAKHEQPEFAALLERHDLPPRKHTNKP